MSSTIPKPDASKVLIPLPSDGEIHLIAGSTIDLESLGNFVKVFAGTGDLYPVMLGMDKGVFLTEGVDPKLRVVIIMRCAKVMDSRYVWDESTALAKNLGFTLRDIDAMASDEQVENLEPTYVLLSGAVDELSRNATLSDKRLLGMLEKFGETLTRKYIAVICWFNFMCRFLNGCRVPLETTDKLGTRTSPF